MSTEMSANEAMATIKGIVYAMRLGELGYDEAKIKCQPYISICNKKAVEIAKLHNKRPFKISFTGLSR